MKTHFLPVKALLALLVLTLGAVAAWAATASFMPPPQTGDIFAVINDKDYAFTLSPEKVFKTAVFMGKVGSVKEPPAKWQDLFFPDIHDLPGD